MKVFRVEFGKDNYEFAHAATAEEIIKFGFCNEITLSGIDVGGSITLRTTGFKNGWDKYPTVKFSAHDYESYICNCCQNEVPGDGVYDICHTCGWENDPSEKLYPDEDCGANHMSLNEGRANFKKFGWYTEPVDKDWVK